MTEIVWIRARVKILHKEKKWVLVKFENGDTSWIPKITVEGR